MTSDWIPNTPFGAWPCAHLLEYTPFRNSRLTVADAEREIEIKRDTASGLQQADAGQDVHEAPDTEGSDQHTLLPGDPRIDGYWDDEIERQFHYEVKGG